MSNRLADAVTRLSRRSKLAIQAMADAGLVCLALILAMWLRLDSLLFLLLPQFWLVFPLAVPICLVVFTWFGFYQSVVRYASIARMARLLVPGVGISALCIGFSSYMLGLPVPRSVPIIFAFLIFGGIIGLRLLARAALTRTPRQTRQRVLIYGAGNAGRQLVATLARSPEYLPVAFVDDDESLQGLMVEGMRVHSGGDLPDVIARQHIDVVMLATPSASRSRKAAMVARLEPLSVKVQTIPGIADLVEGRSSVSEVRNIAIEDILGRDPVAPDPALMAACIAGKTVLVTGAGGSIGAELCRQIVHQRPRLLVLFEVSEFALYAIHTELTRTLARLGEPEARAVPVLGTVTDRTRLSQIMEAFGIQTVYHAAAYKHVPLVENNVAEGVRNNVLGTAACLDAAIAAGAETFLLVSTDKAVRPTNVMGASKRMAELVCQARAAEGVATRICMTRFGNVLGSSGSVIPLFRRQIDSGGPLTVTDPEITRYFMTIPEAAELVIQSGTMARGGDVFVLEMGEPVRIVDLAERMIRLAGYVPRRMDAGLKAATLSRDTIDVVFTGLRPGEKLYEELLVDEAAQPTLHPRIMTAAEPHLPWSELEPVLGALAAACERNDAAAICRLLVQSSTGYVGSGGQSDLIASRVMMAPPRGPTLIVDNPETRRPG